jgi:hypothetical protein
MIQYKYPSRGRPGMFLSTLEKYLEYIENPAEWQFDFDVDDLRYNNAAFLSGLNSIIEIYNRYIKHKWCINFSDNKTKIQAINSNLQKLFDNTTANILFLVSDDMIPVVKGFDKIIENDFKENFPDYNGVLFYNDGFRGNATNTLVIAGIPYIKEKGYIYNPQYRSQFADAEYTEVAQRENKSVYINNVIVRHDHPLNVGDTDKTKEDEIYKRNIQDSAYDQIVYTTRRANNFKDDYANK